MKPFAFISLTVLLFSCTENSKPVVPQIEAQQRIFNAHFRGLYQVNDQIAWASGTNASVLKCTDGEHWTDVSIKDTSDLDFRDIHAFDERNAVVLSAGNGVAIYRTNDGGLSWKLVFENPDSNQFFDGMDFNENGVGVAFGDPIHGQMQLLLSDDFGQTWQEVDSNLEPNMIPGEAGFAASGTGIVVEKDSVFIATGGGEICRLLASPLQKMEFQWFEIPMKSGEGTGVFSMSKFQNHMVFVGGSYIDSTNADKVCAKATNGGNIMTSITANGTRGYRSCVAHSADGKLWIASGRSGMEYSQDYGETWIPLSDDGYFSVCVFDKVGWAIGRNGKLARISLE